MQYEINVLLLQSQTEKLEELRDQIKKLIESHSGKITASLVYQKRKLAYKIRKEQYGFFTVYRFEMEDPEQIGALKKNLNLKAEVARYIIVRADELPLLGQTAREQMPQDAAATLKAEEVTKIISENEEKSRPEGKIEQRPAREKQPEETAPKEKIEKVEEKEEKEEKKEEEKDTIQEKPKKKPSSLEDLDKKLEEILNI